MGNRLKVQSNGSVKASRIQTDRWRPRSGGGSMLILSVG